MRRASRLAILVRVDNYRAGSGTQNHLAHSPFYPAGSSKSLTGQNNQQGQRDRN